MKLMENNYFSPEMQASYMGASQFKAFRRCEAQAYAEMTGGAPAKTSTALLVGSYVDAYYDDSLDIFRDMHPEIFKRDGTLKADYEQADRIIQRCADDPMFAKYMSGKSQVIMTGKIADVPYKIKIDSYHADKAIVDLKVMRDFAPVWDGHSKVPFVEYWGYDIQGAIYQEIVRQNTGKQLPFFIAAATKEAVTDIAIMSVGQERLDECLAIVEQLSPRYQQIKAGEVAPDRCGHCDYCKMTKRIDKIVDYRDLEG